MSEDIYQTETAPEDEQHHDNGVPTADSEGRVSSTPGEGLDILQIASSQMEFYKDQVRILRELGVRCESLSYPPDSSHTEGDDTRRERIHEGWIRRIYGHNGLYYAYRAADFYPRILKTAVSGDYDVVHINSGMVAPLGLLQPERPVVLTLWGDDLLGDRLGGYQSAITEFCAKRCDRVIVRSEERGIWTTAVTRGRLAFDGQVAVRLGGVGWRETVYAQRDGWNVLGNGTAYRVALGDRESGRVVYTSDPVTAAPTLAERNVTVVPTENGYFLRVDRGNTSLSRRVPAKNESVTLDGLTFTRNDSRVFVSYDGTRLQLLAKETYE
jgi:hypothetical protein